MRVEIRRAALDAMAEHARRDAPIECCGLLIGTPARVERAVPARNVRASATKYLVAPEDHFAAIRAARASGLEVVGAYHSHPATPAVPSPSDAGEATYREFLYAIVSLATPGGHTDVRAWRPANGNFEEVILVPIP